MDFAKEVVLPAALSELLSRLFSFALGNFPRLTSRGEAHRRRLERLLLTIGGTVEEAEGRHITNDHLLSQLKELTDGMYRGRFALEETDLDVAMDDNDDVVDRRRSFALCSPFNGAKRLRVTGMVFGRDNHGDKLEAAIEDLESLTRDCMRGEGGRPGQTIWANDGAEYLAGVRSILGKERFAARRSLLIFEDAWPIDSSAWSALAASPTACTLAAGSKLLLTSRDADHAWLCTVEPVVLSPLPQEYWYYFKAFAFRGMDAGDHPRMAAMGKEMARQLGGTFLGARMVGTLLGNKFDARFWHRVMKAMSM
ncbi:Disease resistance protein RGA2 [Triticum urartu]|uniref:Disease resistance protein RGA2 n=1 Tax=Triticum urartu TaxID=4572 RepID=M7ZRH1_TRIUA|nr:Disease resistance protein RGA2 [Triticum urartu]